MTPDEKQAYARQFPVQVGVDTAKQFHVLVAQGPDGRRSRPFRVDVSRAGFEATHAHLQGLFPSLSPTQMLVGLEFAGHHGFTFARFLADRGYPVVNVLPAHTNRSKELEDNSPLKTDAKDAAQIARLVGMGIFVRFPFLTTPYVELRLLSVQRHRLTVEATRFRNRLQGVLDLAWPEFLGQFSGLHKRTPLAILERWPLPQEFVAAAPQAVGRHIRAASRGHVSAERVATLRQSARETIALTQATPERRLEITQLLARWALVREQLAVVEARIVALVDQCPEARVLLSVPEISAACAATIVAELGTPADFQHPRQVLKLAGMNLTGRQSGQTDRGPPAPGQAGPADAPAAALPAGRPLVPAPGPVPARVRGDAGPGHPGDQGRVRSGPEAGAAAAHAHADRAALRRSPVAGQSPAGRGVSSRRH
ncbi:MAG: IS110 family transposase [Gemmatimonadetes bacterium]|nr:IS110 family transposase [Gemmatimonadota bacterium]